MFDLARQLRTLGDEVQLFTGYPSVKVDADLRPITRTRPWWTLASYARTLIPPPITGTWWAHRALEDFGPWLARAIDVNNTDILDALAGTGWEAGRLLHAHGKPWICNRGSTHILFQKRLLEEEHRRWGVRPPDFSRGLERSLGEYEECDRIVVPSHFAKRSFVTEGIPARKVDVCSYGVDVERFAPVRKIDEKFRVLFVGGYSLRKGIGDLFAAVRPLVSRGECELWLVGNRMAEAGALLKRNADIFVDKGPQPRASLAWFYSQGSVLVLPSLEEGLALVLCQAMACGIPIIASTNTGAEDLIDDGVEGFIIPPRDSGLLRERVQWLIDNPIRRREMGTAALARIRRVRGWGAYAIALREVYANLLGAAVR